MASVPTVRIILQSPVWLGTSVTLQFKLKTLVKIFQKQTFWLTYGHTEIIISDICMALTNFNDAGVYY